MHLKYLKNIHLKNSPKYVIKNVDVLKFILKNYVPKRCFEKQKKHV